MRRTLSVSFRRKSSIASRRQVAVNGIVRGMKFDCVRGIVQQPKGAFLGAPPQFQTDFNPADRTKVSASSAISGASASWSRFSAANPLLISSTSNATDQHLAHAGSMLWLVSASRMVAHMMGY